VLAGLIVPSPSVPLAQQRADPPTAGKGGAALAVGPYEAVANWPAVSWPRPGYIWGSQAGIFPESSNRIFLVVPDPTNTEPGGPYPVKTKARWDGSRLVLYTRQGLNQQRDILSLHGTTLNITRDTETPPGSGIDIRLVYKKAS
jgi:hypothetical protein